MKTYIGVNHTRSVVLIKHSVQLQDSLARQAPSLQEDSTPGTATSEALADKDEGGIKKECYLGCREGQHTKALQET